MMVRGEKPLWMPHSNEVLLFLPNCVPDNWVRGMVTAMKPVTIDMFGGKDMFSVEWEYVPEVRGSMVRPGDPYVGDLDHWEDYVIFPNIDEWDWEGCAKQSEELRSDGRIVKVSMMTGLFERLISFVDMTDAMISLVDDDSKPAVHRLLSRICDVYEAIFEKFETYFHPDMIWFHDDWGSQRAPFFSADTVREMIAPYLKRCVDAAHKHGMIFELHSCGQIESLVPVMIECGVDMWNGQTMNDKVKMAKMHGDKIVCDSNPGEISADATPEEVRAHIQNYIDSFEGNRTYVTRHGVMHPLEYQTIYELSRIAYNS